MKKSINKVMAAICCLTLIISSVSLGSCSKDDDSNVVNKDSINGDKPTPTPTPTPTDSIIGTTEAPTDWVTPSGVDYYPSGFMTFVIDSVGSPVVIHDGDIVAAFIGGTCHGVTTVYTGSDNYTRAELTARISNEEANSGETLQVELRYYSGYYKRIYTAQTIQFEQTKNCGELYNGYKPAWIK